MKMETVADVVRRDLCCSCGSCAVTCPVEAIRIEEQPTKGIVGPTVDEDQCTLCGACLDVCPGYALDLETLNDRVFGGPPEDAVMGHIDAAFVTWSQDDDIRYHSASGGIATTLLCDLLEQGEIDGAVVVTSNRDRPLRPRAVLATTPEAIKAASGSKYCPVSLDAGLAKVAARPGRYAVVGLPCHLHGIRAVAARDEVLAERIVLHLGLMCGRNSTFMGTEYFLRGKGIDPEAVTSLAYRAKGWPGQICVALADGSEACFARSTSDKSFAGQRLFHSAFHFDFIVPRCLTCFDTFGVLADVSLGDAWLPEIKREEKIGKSIIIVRTETGRQVVDWAAERGKIAREPLDPARLTSRNLTFARNYGYRMRILRVLGQPVPQYRLPEAAGTCPGGSRLRAVTAALTFGPFLPSLISQTRRNWWLVTLLGYARQVLVSGMDCVLGLRSRLRRSC